MSVVRGESQLAGFPLMAEDESTYDKVAKFPCGSFEPSRGVAYHVLALAYEVPLYESQRGDGMREAMPQWCSERNGTYGIFDFPRLVFPSSHPRLCGETYGTLVVPRFLFTSRGGSGGGGSRRESLFVCYDFCIV